MRGDGTAWNPHRQEYAFAVQAELPSGAVQLTAEEYTTGRLDWPDVDATLGTLGPAPAGRIGSLTRQTRLPVPAGFPGMPADRLWQFEDARVYLGGLEAGPTDLARLALVEFSLVYGVDWFVLPIELAAGSVYWVHQLEVIDTFGTTVNVGSAQGGGWSMFGLGKPGEQTFVANVLALPPVVPHLLESEPLEEVALLRDEMANLVWGVERVVQSADGRPVNRNRQVAKVSLRQQVPGDLADAAIVYRLMTPVPDNWVPFVAVPAPDGGVELERRPLLHFRDDGTTDVTHPIGVLLNEGGHRLRIAEEEVPRDGAVVTRRYQLARTPDGGTVAVDRPPQTGRRRRRLERVALRHRPATWLGVRGSTRSPPVAMHATARAPECACDRDSCASPSALPAPNDGSGAAGRTPSGRTTLGRHLSRRRVAVSKRHVPNDACPQLAHRPVSASCNRGRPYPLPPYGSMSFPTVRVTPGSWSVTEWRGSGGSL